MTESSPNHRISSSRSARIWFRIGMMIALFAAGATHAQVDLRQFTPDSVLNTYSVYGTEYVYLPVDQGSGTATKGWYGSGGDMVFSSNNKVRSPVVTVVGNLVMNNGDSTKGDTKLIVGGNLTLGPGIKTLGDTVQVGGNMIIDGGGVDLWRADDSQASLFVQGTFEVRSGNGLNMGNLWAGSINQTNGSDWTFWHSPVTYTTSATFSSQTTPTNLTQSATPVPSPLGAPPAIAATRLPGYGLVLPPASGDIPSTGFVSSSRVTIPRTVSRLSDTTVNVVRCAALFPAPASACRGDTLQPGNYGPINLSGTNLLIGQGFYSFESITLSNGGGILGAQPDGHRTVVYSRGDIQTSSSSPAHIGPTDAIGVGKFGYGVGEFLGGTFMLIAGGNANMFASDPAAKIWATISAPNGNVSFNSQVKLFGQVFGHRINVNGSFNNIDFGEGAYVPIIIDDPIILINHGDTVRMQERAPTQTPLTYRDTAIAVTINALNAYDVHVDWTFVDGQAVWGRDYTTPGGNRSGSLTIQRGTLADSIRIRILDDLVYEGSEPFRIVLSNPDHARFPDSAATDSIDLFIEDDDPAPVFHFATISDSSLESVTSPVVRVLLSSALEDTVSVDVHRVGGSATPGTDYVLSNPHRLVFPPFTVSQDLPLSVVNDLRDETDETIDFVLRNPLGLVQVKDAVDSAMRFTILDDDASPRLMIQDSSGLEGGVGERRTLSFRFWLADSASGSPLSDEELPEYPVVFQWWTRDSLARSASDTDFLEIAAHLDTLRAASGIRTVTLVGDAHLELDEAFAVEALPVMGLGSEGSRLRGALTIVNDDARPALRVLGSQVVEGSLGQRTEIGFRVDLLDPADGHLLRDFESPSIPVEFDWDDTSLRGSATVGSDYLGKAGRAVVPAGSLSIVVRDTILGDDRFEGPETLYVRIDTLTLGNATHSAYSVWRADGIIVDDEPLPGLRIQDASILEPDLGDTVAMSISGYLVEAASGRRLGPDELPLVPVEFSWFLVGINATDGSDYISPATVPVTVPPSTSDFQVSFRVLGDNRYEGPESLSVFMTPVRNLDLRRDTAIATILDDERPPAPLLRDASVAEGASGSVSVLSVRLILVDSATGDSLRADQWPELPVSLKYSTLDRTATGGTGPAAGIDYGAVASGAISIPALSGSANLPVAVYGDGRFEGDETLLVRIFDFVNANTSPRGRDTATGTIQDDDQAPGVVVRSGAIREGRLGEVVPLWLQVDLVDADGNVLPASDAPQRPTGFTWSTREIGSAISDVDYRMVPLGTPGVVAGGAVSDSIRLEILGDNLFEGAESLAVDLIAASNARPGSSTGFATILDDDAAPVVRIPVASRPEGWVGDRFRLEFEVQLDSLSGLPVPFLWSTRDGSAVSTGLHADFAGASGTDTIAAGTRSRLVRVEVIGDRAWEPDDTLYLDVAPLANAGNSAVTGIGIIANDDSLPVVSVGSASGREGSSSIDSGRVLLPVFLDRPVQGEFRVVASTRELSRPDSATNGADFWPETARTLAFPSFDTATTFAVRLVGDFLDEPDEVFQARLSSPSAGSIGDSLAIGTILDDDTMPRVSFTRSAASAAEGAKAWLKVRLSVPSGRVVTVPVRSSDSAFTWPALATLDYRVLDTVLAFAPGSVLDSVPLSSLQDSLDEEDLEWLVVDLGTPSNASPGDLTHMQVSISDDDTLPVLRAFPDSALEGNPSAGNRLPFHVRLSTPSGRPVAFQWETRALVGAGSATPGVDFVESALSAPIVLPAGALDTLLWVQIEGDVLDEPDEILEARLVSATHATLPVPGARLTILDDDDAPRLRIVGDTVVEPTTGTATLVYRLRLEQASGQAVWVRVATMDGTATQSLDYLPVSDTILRFDPDQGQTERTLAVTVLHDDLAGEGLESLRLRVLSSQFLGSLSDTSAPGGIRDGNGNPGASIFDSSVVEGDFGTTPLAFRIELSGKSVDTLYLAWKTLDGTAKAGLDYRDTSGVVRFLPLTTQAWVTVEVIGDRLLEPDEFFEVRLDTIVGRTGINLQDPQGVGTIIADLDDPKVYIDDADSAVHEGGVSRFRVRLGSLSSMPVRVVWATRDGSARSDLGDYVAMQDTLVFPPNDSTFRMVSVRTLVDDWWEHPETFRVALVSVEGALLSTDTSGVGTILEEGDSVAVSFLRPDTTVWESVGTVALGAQLSRRSVDTVFARTSVIAGDALRGQDYSMADTVFVFAPGELVASRDVVVHRDDMDEYDEFFDLGILDVQGGRIGSPGVTRVNILDADSMPRLRFDSARVDVGEGRGTLEVFLVLSRPSAKVVEALIGDGGTARRGFDYSWTDPTTVRFLPGQTRASFDLVLLDDSIHEPVDSLFLSLRGLSNALAGDPDTMLVLIHDNDDAPSVQWVTVRDSSLEDAGTVRRFLRLSSWQDMPSSVLVDLLPGSAAPGVDFRFPATRIVFPAGSSLQEVPIEILDDSIDEPDEEIRLVLRETFDLTVGADSIHTEVIVDQDPPSRLVWEVRDTSVLENVGQVVLRARLDRPSGWPIRVSVSGLPSGEHPALWGTDLRWVDSTLVIPVGATSDSVVLFVIDDSTDEWDETVSLAIQAGDHVVVDPAPALLTILDDDLPPRVSFVSDSTRVPEDIGGTGFQLALDRPSAKPVTVRLAVSGTATGNGVDHDLGAVSVVFPAGTTRAGVDFRVIDDNIDEPDETVVATFASFVDGRADSARDRGVVVILDNDDPPMVSFARPDTTVKENVGRVDIPFTLSHPSSVDLTIRLRPRSGSAEVGGLDPGSDVVLRDSLYTVVVPALSLGGSFSFEVIGDGRKEDLEDFRIELVSMDSSWQTGAGSSQTVRIEDDDRDPVVVIVDPRDSLRTNQPVHTIRWTWDGRLQPTLDSTFQEGWNLIRRCATDTAGNTGCDTSHLWGDFTPPNVDILRPDSLFLTNNPSVDVCWRVADSGATWNRVDTLCFDTTLTEGTFPVIREACDELGNCGRDQIIVEVDLTPPTGVFVFPPDSSVVRVRKQPTLIRWIDDGDTIWVRDTLDLGHYGWNTFTATYSDKAGNIGVATVHLRLDPPSVESGWYLDRDGDGRIDAAVVEFDAPWTSDTMPRFDFRLGSETRTDLSVAEWFHEGTRGVVALDGSGKPIKRDGKLVYLAPGLPMTDVRGNPVVDPATGHPMVSPVGETWRDGDGKVVRDSQGREMFVVAGPGSDDRSRMVVEFREEFRFGATSVGRSDTGLFQVSLPVTGADGASSLTTFRSGFPMADSVAPVILSATVVRTESYQGKDSLYIKPSESLTLDSSRAWIEIKRQGVWVRVPAESLAVLPDGRFVILVEPGEAGSPRPDLPVRFLPGVSDKSGNVSEPATSTWTTKIQGPPRPPLLEIETPVPVKSVPSQEISVNRPGGFTFRATDRKSDDQFSWWKPGGTGYVSGSDPDIRAVCPDLDYCNGIEVYINKPVRLTLFIYDLLGTHVMGQDVEITQKDIDGLKADKLDRVRVQILWNMRDQQGEVVASGIYLWRIVSWTRETQGGVPIMGNNVVKVGVKSPLQ